MVSVIGTRLTAAFAVAIVLLIANAVVSFRAVNTLVLNNDRVVHTMQMIETLSEALSAVNYAESSQRGYIITGDPSFQAQYDAARPQVTATLSQLKDLAADNPVQQGRIQSFGEAIDRRMTTLQRNLELRETGGFDKLLREGRMSAGKSEMDEVRRIGAEIQAEEDRLLVIRTEQSRISSRNTLLTFLAANALTLALLALVYYLLVRDLTQRKRAAEKLKEAHDELEMRVKERTFELADANTELERSNRELQDFAFVASHDLQEPLRKIQAFGDRLRTKHGAAMDDEAQDYLHRMQNAAGRMHRLINDLLTFSRVTTKARPFEPTDLNTATRDVLSDLEVRIQDTGGHVEVGDLPTIDADPLQVRQLLQNLIGNALKFHRPDAPPIIKIDGRFLKDGENRQLDGDREMYRLSVEDNGIGFEEKYLDRIFTPFQRLHGRNEFEGTGIGLAVCRKIVERHGGSLTAVSRPGEGSTFIATLPVKQA
ncbi:MAG TPA: CHASE3 domain-containing protein [Pyrinomonadaceae bacterium]|nr:CHASE3 domain-containing protein [Pyrinomonadaceae bacterium]